MQLTLFPVGLDEFFHELECDPAVVQARAAVIVFDVHRFNVYLFGDALCVFDGYGFFEGQPLDQLVALGVLAFGVLVAGQRLHDHLVVLERLLKLAERHVRRGPAIVSLQVLGIELYGFGRVGQGVTVCFGFGMCEAAVRIVRGEVVRFRRRTFAHRNRFGIVIDGVRVTFGGEMNVRFFFHPLGMSDVRFAVIQLAFAVHFGKLYKTKRNN